MNGNYVHNKNLIVHLAEWMTQANHDWYAKHYPALLPAPVYEVHFGKRYAKLVSDGSARCFVDIATGDVLKAESWAKPAKGARFNILEPDSLALLKQRWDSYGTYLYR